MAKVTLYIELDDNGSSCNVVKDTVGQSAQQLLDEAYQAARGIVMLATQQPKLPADTSDFLKVPEKRANPVSLVGL